MAELAAVRRTPLEVHDDHIRLACGEVLLEDVGGGDRNDRKAALRQPRFQRLLVTPVIRDKQDSMHSSVPSIPSIPSVPSIGPPDQTEQTEQTDLSFVDSGS